MLSSWRKKNTKFLTLRLGLVTVTSSHDGLRSNFFLCAFKDKQEKFKISFSSSLQAHTLDLDDDETSLYVMNFLENFSRTLLIFLFLLLLDVKLFNPHFFTFSSLLFSFKVSWMRKRDLHILTSNNFLYTGDQRFSVIQPQDTDEWNLKIEYAQPKDAGTYECQVCNYFWFIQSPFFPLFFPSVAFCRIDGEFQISNDRTVRPLPNQQLLHAENTFIFMENLLRHFQLFYFSFTLRMLPSGQHRAENQLCRKFGCRK